MLKKQNKTKKPIDAVFDGAYVLKLSKQLPWAEHQWDLWLAEEPVTSYCLKAGHVLCYLLASESVPWLPSPVSRSAQPWWHFPLWLWSLTIPPDPPCDWPRICRGPHSGSILPSDAQNSPPKHGRGHLTLKEHLSKCFHCFICKTLKRRTAISPF